MLNEIVNLELKVREFLLQGNSEAYPQAIKLFEKLRGLYDDKSKIAEINEVSEAIRDFRGLGTIIPQEYYLESIDPDYPGEERRIALMSAECQPSRSEIAARQNRAKRKIDLFLDNLQKKFCRYFFEHIRNARDNTKNRDYDKAYQEYQSAFDIFKRAEDSSTKTFYDNEVIPSLEILKQRNGLIDKVRSAEKKLREAEEEFERTRGYGEKISVLEENVGRHEDDVENYLKKLK